MGTCIDYDLCESCEAKGIHSGHKMMVISNPQPMWPGHFINHFNKMQNSASKSNSQYRKHGGPCMFPRGTGCPAKGSVGFGRGMKREGCSITSSFLVDDKPTVLQQSGKFYWKKF